MKFSLRWLGQYIDLVVPVPEMLEKLTLSGTEVEHVSVTGVESPQVVVAQILSSAPHPNADRLRVCQVDDGTGTRQIVCGAKNYRDGDKVPLALPGAKLPGGLTIKESKLRGELSQGMLCSAKELALAEDAEGLLILPADAPVGRVFSDYQPGDTMFEVEITSNRPDLLSYRGLAREIAATGAGKLKSAMADDEVAFPPGESTWSVHLRDADLGPYYTATHLAQVKVGPSPHWLQDAIAGTGHRPINNVVDITNYVLFETGQPLHAFDAAKLEGRGIEVRRAVAGEKLEALDDKTYELAANDLVIADGHGPVALAGVMGGKPTGVSETTREIVLEAAWFLPASVRRTSRRLGLMSDSSHRYERRVDPGALLLARNRAIALLRELTGAVVVSQPALAGAPPAARGPITLRAEKIRGLLGVDIPAATVRAQLASLGCIEVSGDDAATAWQPPTFRDDLAREVDLIEELARLHGLAGIPSRLVTGLQPESAADRAHHRVARLRHFLADRGWDECVTDALVERRFATDAGAIALANPLSEIHTHLRPSLRASLLEGASKNLAKGVARLRLFEVGPVYRREGAETREPLHLGLLVAGVGEGANWDRAERPADYFDLSGTARVLCDRLGLADADRLDLAKIAEAEAKAHGIKAPVFYAEFSLEAWLRRAPLPERYQPVAAFPPVRRDLAVVVPSALPQARVEELIRAANAPHLETVQLFDLFRDKKGEKIGADRKSLAYALTYRAPDRTLVEREVNEAHELVRKKLAAELGCTFRDN